MEGASRGKPPTDRGKTTVWKSLSSRATIWRPSSTASSTGLVSATPPEGKLSDCSQCPNLRLTPGVGFHSMSNISGQTQATGQLFKQLRLPIMHRYAEVGKRADHLLVAQRTHRSHTQRAVGFTHAQRGLTGSHTMTSHKRVATACFNKRTLPAAGASASKTYRV
jgi:hypothetical protein